MDSINRFLHVEGSDFERGEQQGLAFRGRIAEMIDDIRQIEMLPLGLQKIIPIGIYRVAFRLAGRSYWHRHEPFLTAYAGADLKAKVAGLARGFGVPRDLVYGLAAMEVITSEMPHVPNYGCTSLAFGATHAACGEPLIAYNHDFPESFGPHLYVRHNRPKQGIPSLSLAYPVLLGAIAGVNEAGLAVSINHAFERRVNKKQGALFVTWLLQDCLDRFRTAEAAAAHTLKTPVTNGSMLTFVDKTGGRAVVELTSRRRLRRAPDAGVGFTFNKYRIPEMEELEIPIATRGTKMFKGRLVHGANIERLRRFSEMYDPHKVYTEQDIHALMSDHAGSVGGMGTICRHDATTSTTLASAILHPVTGEIQMIFGPACCGRYRTYTPDGVRQARRHESETPSLASSNNSRESARRARAG